MFRRSSRKALGQGLKCKILLAVPGEEYEISYNNTSIGKDILNEIANSIDLPDRDYFGLRLNDSIQWLDLTKPVVKQTKGMSNVIFVLKFKYYPAEPALLANESTRYYLYLQLRADLLEGRLRSDSQDTSAYLIACVLQSELGDANTSTEVAHKENYVADYKFLPNQSEELEHSAIALHQSEDFLGLKPADSELNFLKKASQLDTYGVDPYPVEDGNSRTHFLIGVNHRGISTFLDSKRTNLFAWNEIERITLDNKLVVMYVRTEKKAGDKVGTRVRTLFAFRCPSQEHAQNFWKMSSEHKFFFTLEATPETPIVINTGGFFKKSHKLKYAGRVEKDLLRDHVNELRSSGVRRSRSLMAKTNNGPMWQGFNNKHGNSNLQTSLNNLYASDAANKTLPSNMNYFREEEEDEIVEAGDAAATTRQQQPAGQATNKSNHRPSQGSLSNEQQKPFNRKSVLTAKSDVSTNAIRRGSQVYMDTDHQKHDFIRASIILILILGAIFLTLLLINEADRPNSIAYLLKRLNLEQVSVTMRQSYYLPLKSALRSTFGQIITLLDSKLL